MTEILDIPKKRAEFAWENKVHKAVPSLHQLSAQIHTNGLLYTMAFLYEKKNKSIRNIREQQEKYLNENDPYTFIQNYFKEADPNHLISEQLKTKEFMDVLIHNDDINLLMAITSELYLLLDWIKRFDETQS